MSASWSCLKCGTQVPAGMPSYLVVEGTFGSDPLSGRRKFEVLHDMHDALCAACHAEIKAGLAGVPGPRFCVECEGEIKENEDVACQDCLKAVKKEVKAAEGRAPVLEGGVAVAV